MSTLIVVDLTPTDTEKLSAYSAQAAETLKPYGGELVSLRRLSGDYSVLA